jgi:hypothetical protein
VLHVQKNASNIYSDELVEQLFVQPDCRIANLMNNGIAKRATASVYLKQPVILAYWKSTKLAERSHSCTPGF